MNTTLSPGQTIGVMAPSSYIDRADIEQSKTLLEQRGYRVFIHPQTYERHNQSAGNHLQKSLAFQGLWQRDDIHAIWTAGGGNRALHLLDSLNFEKLKAKPKPLIGFSDVTTLLNAVYAHTGLSTYHGPVFKSLHQYKHLDHVLDTLTGQPQSYDLSDAHIITPGDVTAPIVGGNLSLFQYLPQTLPGNFCNDHIILLEDCHEDLSKIDRMILHLKRLGVFQNAAGIIFGGFTDMTESGRPFGFTLEDLVREHTQDLDIPIIMNAPFGHGPNHLCVPIGTKMTLSTQNKTLKNA